MSRFIDEHRGRLGVEPISRVLGVSASAYHQRRTGQRSSRALQDERRLMQIEQPHAANYHAYGYRRTWKALHPAGVQVGRPRQAADAHPGIQGAKRRGKPWRTTSPAPVTRRRPDLVRRDFSAPAPDRLWVADLSKIRPSTVASRLCRRCMCAAAAGLQHAVRRRSAFARGLIALRAA